jgi:anaerobic ribonucleoside-triphosphate reductase activating protein
MRLNIARTLPRSAANGPGERFVVWVQGCPLACPGCWNPDTWSFARRRVVEVASLAEEILGVRGIEGVTFTGGEPFVQARALAVLGRAVRDAGLSVFVFTGLELHELVGRAHRELLEVTDVLVTGRYLEARRATDLPWRGSWNQQVCFLTERYSAVDMAGTAVAEVHLAADGSVILTGFPSAELTGREMP